MWSLFLSFVLPKSWVLMGKIISIIYIVYTRRLVYGYELSLFKIKINK